MSRTAQITQDRHPDSRSHHVTRRNPCKEAVLVCCAFGELSLSPCYLPVRLHVTLKTTGNRVTEARCENRQSQNEGCVQPGAII